MKNVSTGLSDWKFDETIAPVFVEHAKKHIPNYDSVIDKCVRYCELNLSKDAKIIDIGCATGHTLTKLYDQGFTNLHGVDNSEKMIGFAPSNIATYTVSNHFIGSHYDAVLCNWTLHFVKDKISYLKDIHAGLNEDGVLIISEKTSKDENMIGMYHDHKLKLGVSKAKIEQKCRQIENIMFVESVEWYQEVLSAMGYKVNIIDADWCFTTFMCRK